VDDSTGRFTVAGKAPNGQAQPYFDRTRGVWVAPWRRPDGKVGKPTGRTRALAEASRDRQSAISNVAILEGFVPPDSITQVRE
jgi:hypothetical protein